MTELDPIFERLGLAQYLDIFVEEGFDTWETVLEITESDLFRVDSKLQREIANSRGNALESPQEPPLYVLDDGQEGSRVDSASRGKRKYRRHPKPDEHAPERPQSAYVIFSNKIAKKVGERWQVLSAESKEPYETQAAAAKGQYLAAMARYKKTAEYKNYLEYLADFKSKNLPKSGTSMPFKSTMTNPLSRGQTPQARNGSQCDQQWKPRQSTGTDGSSHEVPAAFLGATQGSPTLGISPPPSQSSPASSVCRESPTSPVYQPTATQLSQSFPRVLPTSESVITKGPFHAQSSSLAAVPDNTSPLSNFRRSTRTPATFMRHDTTLSSKSTSSRSTDPSSVGTHPSPGSSGEDAAHYRLPPISAIGLQPHSSYSEKSSFSASSTDAPLLNRPSNSGPILPTRLASSRVQSGTDTGLPHQRAMISNLNLGDDGEDRQPPNEHRDEQTPRDGYPQPNADGLAVLAFAGRILDQGTSKLP
ncbi:MAG: hypothetical protein Q9167_000740 [Letrouitia subvulpina]